jgi:putative signal transducing protein
MSEADLVVVHTFGTRPEADVAQSALEAAGIDSFIQADAAGGTRDHMAWAGTGFRLIVRDEDVAAARDILELPARAQ